MMDELIGEWTVEKLVRFIQQILQESPPAQIPTLACDEFTVHNKAIFSDQVQFMNFQTTVGAAGTASALPANPTGYVRILDFTGQPFVIPYYRAT